MTYITLDPPASEPVSLAEVEAHLRLEAGEEEALVAALIGTAREHLESETGLCLMARTYRLLLDRWPAGAMLRLARAPVLSVEAVNIYAADGTPSAVSGWQLDGGALPPRLWLRERPMPGRAINGIGIDFTAGYGASAADVPAPLKHAILTHVAHLFAFRGVLAPEERAAPVPPGYDRLIATYRLPRL